MPWATVPENARFEPKTEMVAVSETTPALDSETAVLAAEKPPKVRLAAPVKCQAPPAATAPLIEACAPRTSSEPDKRMPSGSMRNAPWLKATAVVVTVASSANWPFA